MIEDLENGRQKKEGESEELTHLTKEVLKILPLSPDKAHLLAVDTKKTSLIARLDCSSLISRVR